jgi:hypothetical protein
MDLHQIQQITSLQGSALNLTLSTVETNCLMDLLSSHMVLFNRLDNTKLEKMDRDCLDCLQVLAPYFIEKITNRILSCSKDKLN